MNNKKGSSTVLIGMISVALTMTILAAILICRQWTIRSECQTFGRLWTKAVLSEYDRHLMEDYQLMAYHGSDAEVQKRLDYYIAYSSQQDLSIQIKSSVNLAGYEMNHVENFNKSLRNSFGSNITESIIKGNSRQKRKESEQADEVREIRNSVVIDTLPSQGMSNTIDVEGIVNSLRDGEIVDTLNDTGANAACEVAFIRKYFDSHTRETGNDNFYRNEWEYLIAGKMNDQENYKSCRRRLFLIRNALNLAYLYSDPAKVEAALTVAEVITPGPLGVITQAILMEAWAAAESEADIQDLLDGERVPIWKTEGTWKIGLGSVLDSDEVRKELDEESLRNLDENREELEEGLGGELAHVVKDGLSYEDYLMVMILTTNSQVRTLRIMDLIQINMKYRYYRDFNWAEYYCGVQFEIRANGKKYKFEEAYQ